MVVICRVYKEYDLNLQRLRVSDSYLLNITTFQHPLETGVGIGRRFSYKHRKLCEKQCLTSEKNKKKTVTSYEMFIPAYQLRFRVLILTRAYKLDKEKKSYKPVLKTLILSV